MIEPDFALPPIPYDEPERLAALHRLGVLDTPPEDELDVITRLAADRFDAAVALVSLVDADRQWFKARHGLESVSVGWKHLHGGDFGPAQGERREPCQSIVTDDRRRAGPKSARPFGVASGSPLAASRRLPGGRQARAARHSCPAGFLTRCRRFHPTETDSSP